MKVFRAGFGRGSVGEGGEGRSRALQIPIVGTIKNSRHQILSLYQNACHFSVSLPFLNKHWLPLLVELMGKDHGHGFQLCRILWLFLWSESQKPCK